MLWVRKYAIFKPLVDFRFIGIDILNYFDTYYYWYMSGYQIW